MTQKTCLLRARIIMKKRKKREKENQKEKSKKSNPLKKLGCSFNERQRQTKTSKSVLENIRLRK